MCFAHIFYGSYPSGKSSVNIHTQAVAKHISSKDTEKGSFVLHNFILRLFWLPYVLNIQVDINMCIYVFELVDIMI